MPTLTRWMLLALLLMTLPFIPGCMLFFCVVEGTPIATPTGPRPVEQIRAGDVVWSRSPDGELQSAAVRQVVASESRDYLHFTFDQGSTLDVTPQHPLSSAHGWLEAGRIAVGDRVDTLDGASNVLGVERVRRRSRVYDVSVEPNNCFFAGSVLVHNKSFPDGPTLADVAGTWQAFTPDGEMFLMEIGEDGSGWASGPPVERHYEPTPADWTVYRVQASIPDRSEYKAEITLSPLNPQRPYYRFGGTMYGHPRRPGLQRAPMQDAWFEDRGIAYKTRKPVVMLRPETLAELFRQAGEALRRARDAAPETEVQPK